MDKFVTLFCLLILFLNGYVTAQELEDSVKVVSDKNIASPLLSKKMVRDSLALKVLSLPAYHSPNQLLDGAVSGLSLFGSYSEPGIAETVLIRAGNAPLYNSVDVYGAQPIYYVNGVPMIQDHPYAFDVQKYTYSRIGPNSNILSSIDPNSIESIRVIKDPLELAALGPLAANGAIWITTKQAQSGPPKIELNSYYGFANAAKAETVNAKYEDQFRKTFYDRFATTDQKLGYPSYLSDSSNNMYYGPSNWSDRFYSNSPIYNVDFSITGGYDRANFIFYASHSKNSSAADKTGLNKFNGTFQINMAPLPWLTTSSMIQFTRMDRHRNRNVRDRIAEIRNIPELSSPLSPNKNEYGSYLQEFDKAIDDNRNNLVKGFVAVDVDLDSWKWNTKLNFDYNEGLRDYFVPSTLMEGNNYVSNYYGNNSRFNLQSTLKNNWQISDKHQLDVSVGMDYIKDRYKYNYATAYNGPNDYIKINVVNGDKKEEDYLLPTGFKVYRYTDMERLNLLSFFFNADYAYLNKVKIKALVRNDGSSSFLSNNKWFLSGGLKGSFNLNEILEWDANSSTLQFHAGVSRNGQSFLTDRYSKGPQYVSNVAGWDAEPTLGSYNGFSGLSRPYSDGWIGYDIKRPYSDNIELSLESKSFNSRLTAQLTYYQRNNKDQLFKTPVPVEFGYTYSYSSGLEVKNQGFELDVHADLVNKDKFKWVAGFNIANQFNKLTALPNGASELIVNDRKLEVGKSTSQFWLYENIGEINTANQIPVNPNTAGTVKFRGLDLNVGDPLWEDVNNDYVIDDNDKILQGQIFPRFRGGLLNRFSYGSWDAAIQLTFSLGGHALNKFASSRLDFINSELSGEIDDVKEIFFWQKRMEDNDYPTYNPWSDVVPYRVDQDLFLQSTDYLKLKSLSVGYDLSKLRGAKSLGKTFERLYIYAAATNLFTISSFYGNDPELANIYGIYDGYTLPVSQTYTLGLKLNL